MKPYTQFLAVALSIGTFALTQPTFAAVSANTILPPHPLTCEVVINKAPAWSAFDVNVTMNQISDNRPGTVIDTYALPKAAGKTPSVNTVKKSFDCSHQNFLFVATYMPPIWRTTSGQPTANVFPSTKLYDISSLTMNPPKDMSTLTVVVNFPTDFGVDEDPNLVVQHATTPAK